MGHLIAVSLVLLVLLAGCATQERATEPTPQPQVAPGNAPANVPFEPASLCGGQTGKADNSIFSVRQCGNGLYVIYSTCCGQEATYVDSGGKAVEATADVKASCPAPGDNLCAQPNDVEPTLCPTYNIAACPDYSSPVCGRIRDSEGVAWEDFGNDCSACKDGKGTGGEVVYLRGTCASRGIQTRSAVETAQKNSIYTDLLGKEITLFAQHYGLAGREVKITVESADIRYMDKVTYKGQVAWRVTLTREFEGIPRTVYIYYDEDGRNAQGEQQLQ
jgi:hypothetical protein